MRLLKLNGARFDRRQPLAELLAQRRPPASPPDDDGASLPVGRPPGSPPLAGGAAAVLT